MTYYLIVNQEEMLVEFYTREGEKWTFASFSREDDMIELPLFSLQITLKEIYAGVNVEAG